MSTPLPSSAVGCGAIYSPSGSSQQPRAAPVAHFASLPNDGIGNDVLAKSHPVIPTSGRLLAANSNYIAYAVKKGLVRVIDRHTAAKTLLRGHGDQTRIVDAAFFGTEGTAQRKEGISALWNQLCSNAATSNDGGGGNAPLHSPPAAAADVLATVGGMKDSACVLIWRIKRGANDDELEAEKLFELRYPHATRIVWHPFNPNRFLLLTRTYGEEEWGNSQRSVASIVETSRLKTTLKVGHALCECGDDKVLNGASQFFVSTKENTGANDVSWSHVKDARHVITGHDDGKIRLWDLTKNDGSSVTCVHELDVISGMEESQDKRVTRVLFLSQYESVDSKETITPPFVVGTNSNQTITLWSGFPSNGDAPQRLRVFRLGDTDPTSFVSVEMCPSPYRPPVPSSNPAIPSSFLLLAERKKGCVHALHIDTEWKKDTSSVAVKGFDYVSTLNVVHPVYSFCIAPTDEIGASLREEKDVELCCVQSKAVQVLTLSAAMCAAPSKDDGGTERGDLASGVALIDLPSQVSDDEAFGEFEDEYDMEDEVEYSTNHSGGLDDEDDAEDAAVVPTATATEPNAFSNWLGAIANPIPVPVSSAPTPPSVATNNVKSPTPPPGLGFPSILPPLPTVPVPDVADSQFLSPMQVLSGGENKADESKKAKKKKDSAKKAQTPATPIAPVAILKREEPKKDVAASMPPQESVDSSSAGMEAVLSSYMKSHEAEMAAVIRKAVASEVETAVRSSMKGVERAAEQAVQRALAADGKFERKMEKQAKESAALAAKEAIAAMQAPIVSSLHQVMREVMIPAYESATRQIFHQISASVEKGLAQRPANDENSSAPLQTMAEQMMKMAVAIQTLSNEVAELRGEVKSGGKVNGAVQQTQQTQTKQDVRAEIVALCHSNRYEEAFTKAVSASDGDVVLFACKNADSSAVFGGDSVGISQPILICLMQQLGAILVSTTDAADFKILLAWLQEIAVTIDPADASIQRHVASVVQQLLANINSKMANCDHAFRRPLQTLMQVIRGLALQ
ncbi:hypothetical protein ACHAXM_011316 [Skeletonema potamos]